ncbi:MAG TPA: hypothetical protein H9848_08635 [Candidatus Parabacteroides intestinigallinarum]|uniref:Uncharacterized protein n=1 Tax=Candidatus Parabacteroides intestinigallinarum TaxID=2838722 RepID=A0A9D2BR74_9BACT|nr:hypothetical protein [Candidatus Parabacteroides intestinigallinarum]
MATNSYKSIESSGTKVEELVVAYQQTVYTLTDSEQKLIMRAEQDIKAGRIYTQAQVDKMADGINDSSAKESFEERYRKAKDFAYKHFDKDFIQYLEARNFLVDEPFPAEICETEEDLERLVAESEASGECTQEEVDKMYAIWEDELYGEKPRKKTE